MITVSNESSFAVADFPKLDAKFTKNDYIHFCTGLEAVPTGFRVRAVCRAATYRNIERIVAVDSKRRRTPLFFQLCARENGNCYYDVLIPAALFRDKLVFNVIGNNGENTRVWAAGASIQLPKHWLFTRHSLSLTYDPNFVRPPPVQDDWKHFFRSIEIVNNELILGMCHFGNTIPIRGELSIFKFRDEAASTIVPFSFQPAKTAFRVPAELHKQYTEQRVMKSKVVIDISSCFKSPGLYSVMVRFDDGRVRGLFPFNRFYSQKQNLLYADIGEKTCAIHHFSDRSSKNIRLEFFCVPKTAKTELMAVLDPSCEEVQRELFLCGEYTTTARDNGWAIFRHLQSSRDADQSAYVIDAINHDRIVPDGKRILEYGSIEHLRACRRAAAVLFSHHSIYVLPNAMRLAMAKGTVQPVNYFLQHGVLAIKPVLDDYAKKVCGYNLFNVSSKREQELVVRKCGFDKSEVIVAGLPRWDKLRTDDASDGSKFSGKAKILIFPTWRRGLDKLTPDEFLLSEYYSRWRSALQALSPFSSEDGHEIVFCIHSVLERFREKFDVKNIALQPLVTVIESLHSFDLIVTDYSSLCFDFLYLNKPSVFYMFDKDEAYRSERPYVELSELPGPIVASPDELVDALFEGTAIRFATLRGRSDTVRSKYAAFSDSHNCARVVAAVDKYLSRDATKSLRPSDRNGY